MPAESPYERTRQRVECTDEKRIEHQSLDAAVQPRLDGKPFFDDAHVVKVAQQLTEFRGAVLAEHRRILMLERHLRQLRQRIQPRYPVIDLKNCLAARLEHPATLVDETPIVRRVLHDAVGVDEIERVVRKRKLLAVGL